MTLTGTKRFKQIVAEAQPSYDLMDEAGSSEVQLQYETMSEDDHGIIFRYGDVTC